MGENGIDTGLGYGGTAGVAVSTATPTPAQAIFSHTGHFALKMEAAWTSETLYPTTTLHDVTTQT